MTKIVFDRAQRRLQAYFDRIGKLLDDEDRRASFATYAVGLLTDGERKSMEPIAARASASPKTVGAAHQRLHHFVANSDWSDADVRREGVLYALDEMQRHEPVAAWLVDDTGFLKQGSHSVGVQRQYTGSAGKVCNCQIGVSLSLATQSQQLPVDFELYLPKSWIDDEARREKAGIPSEVTFRTKPEQALEMIQRAVEADLPRGVVLADAAYGNSSAFRNGIRGYGLDFAVACDSSTKVWLMDRLERRRGEALSVKELATELGAKAFRRMTWRQGTRRGLSSRFAFRRVVPFHDDGFDTAVREAVWLVMEWEDGETSPTKFFFATLPENMSKKQLVRIIKLRWRTERMYEDLKGELGLDHFEGRNFRGWHHHVSVVMVCYAFVVAEHARAFFFSTGRKTAHPPKKQGTTRAPLRRFVHHRAHRDRTVPVEVVATLPDVPPPEILPVVAPSSDPIESEEPWVTQ